MGKLMASMLGNSISSVQTKDESLFSGLWIRWRSLNVAERLVCTIIVLMPLWWALGLISRLLFLVTLVISFYEWRRYGQLSLKRPSLAVIALFMFYTYSFVAPLVVLPPNAVINLTDVVESAFGFSLPFLAWYIQSNNTKIRLNVVAWACSISVIQSLVIWLVAHFVFANIFYTPPLTLWAALTGKTEYIHGIAQSNYLLLYLPTDRAIGGLPRFYSFFYYPEYFGLFVSVVAILALDVKNRLWSLLLFAASVFLIGLSGTRSVWIAFPVVLVIRFLLTTSKMGGRHLLFALFATMSFLTLSVPPVTNLVFNTATDSATFISKFRENSTNDRAQVYEQTMDGILDNPVNFVFGHIFDGPEILGTGIHVGSHSFILGALLYKKGLLGTGLFMTFWASLTMWLYQTRIGRPACCFLILLLLSITFATMLLSFIAPMAILLIMMLRRPAPNLRRNAA